MVCDLFVTTLVFRSGMFVGLELGLGIPLLCISVHFCNVGGRIIIKKINGMCTPTPTIDPSIDNEAGTIPKKK